jgi:hypothetical protein
VPVAPAKKPDVRCWFCPPPLRSKAHFNPLHLNFQRDISKLQSLLRSSLRGETSSLSRNRLIPKRFRQSYYCTFFISCKILSAGICSLPSWKSLLMVARTSEECLPKRPHSSFMWCRSLTGRSRHQETRLSYPETQDDSPLFGVPPRVPGVLEEA